MKPSVLGIPPPLPHRPPPTRSTADWLPFLHVGDGLKKTIRWAYFPRENPPVNVFVYLLMQRVAALPHVCRLRDQFVASDTSNMLFLPNPLIKLNECNIYLGKLSVFLKRAWDDEPILNWAHISANILKRCRSLWLSLWLSRLPSISN